MIGLGTRFFSASLLILTVVAIAVAHWPAEWVTLADLLKQDTAKWAPIVKAIGFTAES